MRDKLRNRRSSKDMLDSAMLHDEEADAIQQTTVEKKVSGAREGHWVEVEDATGVTEKWFFPSGYRLIRTIGRGSFGVVVEVQDENGVLFAAKRVQLLAPPKSAPGFLALAASQMLRRLLREGRWKF